MSIKKLQDLLNINSQGGRDSQRFCSQPNRSPSCAPSQFSPLGTNLTSGVSRSPSYTAIPGVQNVFYHPLIKNQQQETVCPSPMFQVPSSKKDQQGYNSLFQGSRMTAQETNPTTNHSTVNVNNISGSLNSLLNQLQPQCSNQPRNLEELLQRSFSSMPSNSIFQSPFTSSMQSPFMCGNNHTSNIQPSIASDFSKILNPITLLETSLQNNNFLNNQAGKNTSNDAINRALILQLAEILKQESESKIKSAIAELILKYRALGLLNNLSGTEMLDLQNLIKGTETPQNNSYPYQPNHQEIITQMPHQNAISLSNGMTMNAIPRNDVAQPHPQNMHLYNSNLQQARVDAARKELFAMNEPPICHQPPANHYQMNMVQQETHFQPAQHHLIPPPQTHSQISPINTLDKEMNSLNLNPNMHVNNFSNYGITSAISAPEKMDDLASEDLGSILKNKVPSDEELPGIYNKYERINKILKYKNKIRKWRTEHPVKRVFKGRSLVAGQKPRIKGKFVTLEEYQDYLTYNCKKEYDDSIKEEEF